MNISYFLNVSVLPLEFLESIDFVFKSLNIVINFYFKPYSSEIAPVIGRPVNKPMHSIQFSPLSNYTPRTHITLLNRINLWWHSDFATAFSSRPLIVDGCVISPFPSRSSARISLSRNIIAGGHFGFSPFRKIPRAAINSVAFFGCISVHLSIVVFGRTKASRSSYVRGRFTSARTPARFLYYVTWRNNALTTKARRVWTVLQCCGYSIRTMREHCRSPLSPDCLSLASEIRLSFCPCRFWNLLFFFARFEVCGSENRMWRFANCWGFFMCSRCGVSFGVVMAAI